MRPLHSSIGGPLFAVHSNGIAYATFSGPNQALAYWRGLDSRTRTYFRIEDADGHTVTLKEHHAGHASAILDKLDRKPL